MTHRGWAATRRRPTSVRGRTPRSSGHGPVPQSEVVESRDQLDRAFADAALAFPKGFEVPVPDHWGGFVVRPWTVEFWQGRPGRMHDRLRYRRGDDGRTWVIERLAP